MGLLHFGMMKMKPRTTWRAARVLSAAVGMSLALLAVGGCRNPVAEERDRMYLENRELRAQNEALRSTKPTDPPIASPDPVRPPPGPSTVASLPPVVVPPAPPVAPPPTPPTAPPDLGGDEVKVDPQAGTTTVTFIGGTLFKSGAADLEAPAKQNLAKLVSALKGQYAGKKLEVRGHTDADPIRVSKWKSNQELSDARAKAVKDYLIANGVDATRVTSRGFGESQPKTADPKQKAQNRRVEVVVLTR